MVALAIGGVSLLLGLEVAGALAATADQPTFVVHYPQGSRRVLQGQTITTVMLAACIGGAVVVGRLADSAGTVAGILLIVIAGALGASMQARLGSPDLAALVKKYGVEQVSKVLWLRALLGPLLVLAITIMAFHQYLRPGQVQAPFGIGIAALLVAGFLVATAPLERRST